MYGERGQGRNEVYFFVTDPVFLPEILIPDPKNVAGILIPDPKTLRILIHTADPDPRVVIPDPGAEIPDPTSKKAVEII